MPGRLLAVLFVLSGFQQMVSSQTITTADTFFNSVSDVYQQLSDYSVNMAIQNISTQATSVMKGRALFKKPNLLRVDFTQPDEQTIVFIDDTLTIYLPAYNVVLQQQVEKSASSSGASLATPQGLALLRRYYTIAYETGPDPVGLEEGSREQVIILTLSRRSTTEIFRTIRLMISPDTRLIRRIDARTITGEQIVFDFTSYALNQGILDNRFIYDSPRSANTFNNFLFNE